jgi:uncharacterized protein YegJ (DUF2314 family)
MATAACSAPAEVGNAQSDEMVVYQRGAALKEMAAAEDQARDSFDIFLQAHEENDGGNSRFAVKIGKPTPNGGTEYLWVTTDSVKDGAWSGRLLNTPVEIPNLKVGAPVEFVDDDIVDWTFTRGGKDYGQFTTRVMLKNAPADQKAQAAEQLRRLWPTPLPEKR